MPDIKPEIKHGNLTLTPQAPTAGGPGWIAGDPPPFPPANPPVGSAVDKNGVFIVAEVNGVIQTQLPYPPINSYLSNAIR